MIGVAVSQLGYWKLISGRQNTSVTVDISIITAAKVVVIVMGITGVVKGALTPCQKFLSYSLMP